MMYEIYADPGMLIEMPLRCSVDTNHIVRIINAFVESMPDSALLIDSSKTKVHRGRPAHHPRKMVKVLLYAYTRQVYSGRKIEQMIQENVPMMWLTHGESICYRSINAFRSNPEMKGVIETAMAYFSFLLIHYGLISEDTLFIDGTKIEADANKYSFVWRKAVEKHNARLVEKIKSLYQEIIAEEVNLVLDEESFDSSKNVEKMIEATQAKLDQVEQAIADEPNHIPGGSLNKRRRRQLKKSLRLIKECHQRKQKYEAQLETFKGRNSYSKTDLDATFMCMKEDPMKNRELKPGYNCQVASNNGFVLWYDTFPNPTDVRTLKPFVQSIPTLDYFSTICADAGYGSEENYEFVIDELGKRALIPYYMYEKEKTKKYQTDPSRRTNWTYDEILDVYVDLDGVQFSYSRHREEKDRYGYVRMIKIYVADKVQANERLDQLAKTPSGRQRSIQINMKNESYRAQVKADLESDSGSQIYARRKIDVEGVFGNMKRNFGVRRTHLRGEKGVRIDLGLLFMAMNLQKLWIMIGKIQAEGAIFFYIDCNISKSSAENMKKVMKIIILRFS